MSQAQKDRLARGEPHVRLGMRHTVASIEKMRLAHKQHPSVCSVSGLARRVEATRKSWANPESRSSRIGAIRKALKRYWRAKKAAG